MRRFSQYSARIGYIGDDHAGEIGNDDKEVLMNTTQLHSYYSICVKNYLAEKYRPQNYFKVSYKHQLDQYRKYSNGKFRYIFITIIYYAWQ